MAESYSFIDIFNREIHSNGTSIQLNRIVIPIIQRDYAQGRKTSDINRVREKFIDALYDAVTGEPIVLDFIYGNIEKDGILTPLDGQQRLTTLFLLHWYAAKKDNVNPEDYAFLKKFSYETRYSAREFCNMLVDYNPTFERKISEDIINQSWFPLDWLKDQTISSMLTMLDTIDEKFSNTEGVWKALSNNAITFYFLPIKDMGLSDELYIKMNSRGKPLSRFENFKAELEHEIKKIDKDIGERIIHKIDNDWTDILWTYRDEKYSIDDFFLRYFKYVCDIICYKNNGSPANISHDEIDLISEFFSSDLPNVKDNLLMLEKYFDCWYDTTKELGISNFFNKYLDEKHVENKIAFDKNGIDVFRNCIYLFGEGQKVFPFGRQIFLYAFITFLLHQSEISENQFRRRIRIINNLINNSSDEISSNSETRTGGNKIPAALRQVDSIIINGVVPTNDEKGFNARQLKEEKIKLEWTEQNPDLSESLFELEDSELLYGHISVVGIENSDLFGKFLKLFSCNLDKVDCALLTIGDYSQPDVWRTQLGSKGSVQSWKELFHKTNYEKTKKVLCSLLSKMDVISNDTLSTLIESFLNDCEEKKSYSWRYYYIKYDIFRPGAYGKYDWNNGGKDAIIKDNQYNVTVMVTNNKLSQNSYNAFLKAIDKNNMISREDLGDKIIGNGKYIKSDNKGYSIYSIESNSLIEQVTIDQDEQGVDKEDRIIKMKKYLEEKGF